MVAKRCLQLVLVIAPCLAPALAQDLPPITDHKTMAFQARAQRHPDDLYAFQPLVEEAQKGNRDALTALIELAREPQTAQFATQALAKVGPPALPALHALRSLLADIDDSHQRFEIVLAIGKIGPEAESAIGDLVDILQNEPNICSGAIDALAMIGRAPGIAVPALAWTIDSLTTGCQIRAIQALGSFQTMPAVDVLITVLDAKQDYFRVAALESLGRIGPLAASAEYRVAELLGSENNMVRSAAELTMTLITGRLGADDGDGDLRRAILSISDQWYAAHRDDLHFEGVCVSSEPVEGLFEVSARVDLAGVHGNLIRYGGAARRALAAELEPLVENLRQKGFSVRVNLKPCYSVSASTAPRASVQMGPD